MLKETDEEIAELFRKRNMIGLTTVLPTEWPTLDEMLKTYHEHSARRPSMDELLDYYFEWMARHPKRKASRDGNSEQSPAQRSKKSEPKKVKVQVEQPKKEPKKATQPKLKVRVPKK